MAIPKVAGTDLYTDVARVINEDATEMGFSYRKTQGKQIWIECEEDRIETQENLEIALENKIDNVKIDRQTSNHSVDLTVVSRNGDKISIVYKNRSGGMSETTLNSTITELFPAIAFEKKISNFLRRDDFYKKILAANSKKESKIGGAYKNDTARKAGRKFISDAEKSSKFVDKTDAAIGIYQWILFEHERRSIKSVVWGYRNNTKPDGVNPNHKGDVFLVFQGKKKGNPDIMGVSIKAGALGTKPPQFNSYVRAIYNSPAFRKLPDYDQLKRISYDDIYKPNIPDCPAFSTYGSQAMTNAVAKLESGTREQKNQYENLYDQQLEWVRGELIGLMNGNQDSAKRWLLEEVAKEQQDVPLTVIQSSGSRLSDVHEVNDEDIIKNCVSVSNTINAYKSTTSKQNWHIALTCKKKTTTLNFSIRTNKSGSGHKLGQYINLAVKFNGVA